jgi:hypothetical protein
MSALSAREQVSCIAMLVAASSCKYSGAEATGTAATLAAEGKVSYTG